MAMSCTEQAVPLQGAGDPADLAGVEDPAGPAAEAALVGHGVQDRLRGQLGPPGVEELDEGVLGADVLVEGGAQLGGQLRVGVPAARAGPRPQGVQEQLAGAGAQQVHGRGAAEGGLADAVQLAASSSSRRRRRPPGAGWAVRRAAWGRADSPVSRGLARSVALVEGELFDARERPTAACRVPRAAGLRAPPSAAP